MERLSALIGFVLILAIAYGLSNNKKAIRWRIVVFGLVLQVIIALAVLKGKHIAAFFDTFMPYISSLWASLIFIALTVIVYFIARALDEQMRRYLWWGYGVVAAILFLSYNLLAYVFENMKHVVNKLIGYTQEGSKFVFGTLGDPNTNLGFIFATQVLPTIIFIASIFAILYYIGVMQLVVRFFEAHDEIHGRFGRGVDFGCRIDLHGTD